VEEIVRAKVVIGGVCAVLILQGCATPPGSGGEASKEGGIDGICFAVAAAAAITCGLIARGNDRVRAAAACTAVAFAGCYLVNSYQAKQTQTAKQVEDDYLRTNQQLPEKTVVTAYKTSLNPATAIRRGQSVSIESQIAVVKGRADPTVKIEEELTVLDSRGQVWGQPVRKAANATGEGGEFSTSFKLAAHEGMSQGVYRLNKKLYVNGVVMRSDEQLTLQIAGMDWPSDRALALFR
jgi:hypothetical protein